MRQGCFGLVPVDKSTPRSKVQTAFNMIRTQGMDSPSGISSSPHDYERVMRNVCEIHLVASGSPESNTVLKGGILGNCYA